MMTTRNVPRLLVALSIGCYSLAFGTGNFAQESETPENDANPIAQASGDTALREYLDRDFPAAVTRVNVDAQQVTIEGRAAPGEGLRLAEVPIDADVTASTFSISTHPIEPDGQGMFSVVLDRAAKRADGSWDRLLSRWAVTRKTAAGLELLSHARYADQVAPRHAFENVKPRTRKGLGALGPGRPLSDLEDLGIAAVTVNITLDGLVHLSPGERRAAHEFAGRTWYADERTLRRLDRTMREAAERKLIVSAIILLPQAKGYADPEFGKLIAHPDADASGIFVMPNVTRDDAVLAYAAALDVLAERYSRPDGEHGRIHHWIMHNEVNSGWVWTNAGEKTPQAYMDLYHRSMRIAHLVARQYDPNAKAFISLDHHWTTRHNEHCYRARDMLDLLLDFSHAEGDFDWGIAHHPYPQNLGNPRVWENDEATYSFGTPKITFKNLEVLDAWVRQPRAKHLGQHVRTIHLSEQGLNSRSYRERALRDQAAGMAFAWNKMKPLDSIEVFHYHNWVDNRGEGGLRIGLRKFPDDADDPLGKKPIWYVFQAIGTAREAEVTDAYKAVIGIEDWSEILYTGAIAPADDAASESRGTQTESPQ